MTGEWEELISMTLKIGVSCAKLYLSCMIYTLFINLYSILACFGIVGGLQLVYYRQQVQPDHLMKYAL
jgi:hypothetical protein